jgi:hypothetical protein
MQGTTNQRYTTSLSVTKTNNYPSRHYNNRIVRNSEHKNKKKKKKKKKNKKKKKKQKKKKKKKKKNPNSTPNGKIR